MLLRLVQRGYEKTGQEWKNFTGTLADKAQQTFIKECDTAYHLVTSGAMSYSQAVIQAVERTARDGVTVEYTREREDGTKYVYHTDTVETATLRAVRTGVSQACGEITDARMEEMDWDIVLTSAHLGARTGTGEDNWKNHYWWQGKFYSRTGRTRRFPRFDVCGYGYVDGIHGANCRHSHGPGDGEHNPFEHFDSEENRLREERDERMRLLERRIRASRREVLALQEAVEKAPDDAVRAEAEAAHRRKAKVLMRQEKEYDEFCEENKTRKLYDRLQVARYGAKQARAAEKAADVSGEFDAVRNRAADGEQFERYRKVLGDEAPRDLAEFQRVKYNEAEKWEDLKEFYRYKKRVPNSSLSDALMNRAIQSQHLVRGHVIPLEPKRAYILEDLAAKDPAHIMKRMKERLVTDDDVHGFMDEAIVCVSQFKGSREVYYSRRGVAVITKTKDYPEVDWIFKTTWNKADFDYETIQILKEAERYYGR